MIMFKPGDQIEIRAGGCVQTGGHGDTWKRYVNPTGDDSDRLYHGLLWIPGATGGGLQRIAGLLAPKIFTVPSNLPAISSSDLKLHLGYEDDDYSDNGYYAHDNGNDDQCKNVGDAWVEIKVKRGGSPPAVAYSRHSGPFDLVWNQADANLLPLNPIWAFQLDHAGQRPPLGVGCAPPNGPARLAALFNLPCTSQSPSFDLSEQFFGFLGVCNGDVLNGHANWMITTFEGMIKWEDHSPSTFGDDDYNFGLYPQESASLTDQGNGLGLEFEARETIDHFSTRWWDQFHKAVDGNGPTPQSMVDGKYAIVTGLFGIDGVHGGWSESHPVFSLAIRESSSPLPGNIIEERWVFFLRNWGNEGQCSHDQHYFDAADGSYFIQVPWRNGAQSVDIAFDKTVVKSNFPSAVSFALAPGAWVYLKAALPNGETEPVLHGEIVLRWTPAPGATMNVPAFTFQAAQRAHATEANVSTPRGLSRILDPGQRKSVADILSNHQLAAPNDTRLDNQVSVISHVLVPYQRAVDPRTVPVKKDRALADRRRGAENDLIRQKLEAQFGSGLQQLRLRPDSNNN